MSRTGPTILVLPSARMPNSFTSDVYRHARVRTRGYLPHWEVDGGTYFITFRTADSLAAEHLVKLREERCALEKKINLRSAIARHELAKAMLVRIDSMLDRGHGSLPLLDPRLAKIVAESVSFFDARRYRLISWCVMPNHAHVLARLFTGVSLDGAVHSWKSYTSNKINEVRATTGRFWAREYYDHICRDDDEIVRVDQYIRDNLAKAGLADWRWVGSNI